MLPEGWEDAAVIVRPAEVVLLIGGGQQLHVGAAVLPVHLTTTAKYASDIPSGQLSSAPGQGEQFSLLVLQNFPAGRGQSFGVQIKVVVVMFYISYLKKK